jgi:hypothetical protein
MQRALDGYGTDLSSGANGSFVGRRNVPVDCDTFDSSGSEDAATLNRTFNRYGADPAFVHLDFSRSETIADDVSVDHDFVEGRVSEDRASAFVGPAE